MTSVLTFNGHGLKLMTSSGYVRVSGEIYDPIPKAEITFRFSSSSYTPTTNLLGYSKTVGNANWEQVSGADWKVVTYLYTGAAGSHDETLGIGRLCTTQSNVATFTTAKTGGVTAEIISVVGPGIQTMDRAFTGCDAITGFKTAVGSLNSIPGLFNVNEAFSSCTGVIDDSALTLYTAWSQNADITSHSATFSNCGPAQYLSQIPTGWGGTQIPASTLMTTTRSKWMNNYDQWHVDSNPPNFISMNGVYIFTESSVSSFAGVSMNRSRIAKFNGLDTGLSTAALYFYPCFMQHYSTITWAVTTDVPNGSLAVGQANTDMAGTLDYSTYGPFSHKFGNFNSFMGGAYFCFLVTNNPISSSFDLSTDPYGVLFNPKFKTDAGLRWFTE